MSWDGKLDRQNRKNATHNISRLFAKNGNILISFCYHTMLYHVKESATKGGSDILICNDFHRKMLQNVFV